jgi:hypothetical protein
MGERGRLGFGGAGTGGGGIDSVDGLRATVIRDLAAAAAAAATTGGGNGVGVSNSGEGTSRLETAESLVVCREGAADWVVVGGGDAGVTRGVREGPSLGDGSVCITFKRSLLVRIAADWIIVT